MLDNIWDKKWTKCWTKNGQKIGQTFWKLLEVGGAGGTPLAVTQEDCLVVNSLGTGMSVFQQKTNTLLHLNLQPFSQGTTSFQNGEEFCAPA